MSFVENGRQHGGAGFRGQLWCGAFGLGNFLAVGLGSPLASSRSGFFGRHQQFGVRTLKVDEVGDAQERKSERPKRSNKSHHRQNSV